MLLPPPGPRLKQDAYGSGQAAADRKNLDQNASARTAEPSHQGPRQQRPEAKRSTLPAGGNATSPSAAEHPDPDVPHPASPNSLTRIAAPVCAPLQKSADYKRE